MTYSKLSIVIPVYNEVNTIHEVLRQISDVQTGLEKEIILVDDCSTDGTREVLEKISSNGGGILDAMPAKDPQSIKVVFHEQNTGKGGALRTGFRHTTGDITIVQDADLEYDPHDYPRLIKPIIDSKADVVYGSRFLGHRRPKGMIFGSFVANRVLTLISNVLTGLSLTDMETCYKTIKSHILREIELTSDRFGIEPEITAKLAKKHVKIMEIPIAYFGRDHTTGKKINWKDGLAAVYHILRFNLSGRPHRLRSKM